MQQPPAQQILNAEALLPQRAALRALACHYARLVDNRAYGEIPQVFTETARLEGPGYAMQGHAELRAGLMQIEQYQRTLHCVHNQLVEFPEGAGADVSEARGEVYCVANHIYEREGAAHKLDMGIRYEDAYQKEDGLWRIATRRLNVIWQQDLPLEIPAPKQ